MIRSFHSLRRHEEGQALVLAAISMLILTLCILSTINLTYAAKERIRLQNTADAAAYSTAAYQARAMNFFAYTNRAMVVQYAGQMNLMAVLSFMSTSLLIATILENLLKPVPVLGVIFTIIKYLILIYYYILNITAMLALPIIDGLNYGLALAQTGVWTAMGTRLLGIPGEEVSKSNPNYRVEPIGALLGGLSPAALGINGVVNADPTPNLGGLLRPRDPNYAFNRLLMTEMANSARSEWTAKGNKKSIWIAFFIPRSWRLSLNLIIFSVTFARQARTEWGSLVAGQAGGGGIIGSILNSITQGALNPTDQLFSIDRFLLGMKLGPASVEFRLDCIAKADRDIIGAIGGIFGAGKKSIRWETSIKKNAPWWAGFILDQLMKPLKTAVDNALKQVQLPILPLFHFGQTPYARFIPQGRVSTATANSGLFNQPPVFLMVTAPSSYLQSRGRPFMNRFGPRVGSLSSSQRTNDGSYSAATQNKTPSKRGYVDSVDFAPNNLAMLGAQSGFHAVSAAMAYYHRPGDWREPPNLFNPFWGAKLMPVVDYPSMRSNPLLSSLFATKLVVH